MSIDARCPGCRATIAVPARLDGKRIRCKACGEEFRVGGDGPADEGDDYGEPPRRKHGSSALPIVLIVGGVVLVGVVGVLGVGVLLYLGRASTAPMARPAAAIASPAIIPQYTLPPPNNNHAFGRADQPTEGAVQVTLTNLRRAAGDVAGEPVYQVDFQWQGGPPEVRGGYHLFVKAPGGMTDTFLHVKRGEAAGTFTFSFHAGANPGTPLEVWVGTRKLSGPTWTNTRHSNVVTIN